jgi:plastocyanin
MNKKLFIVLLIIVVGVLGLLILNQNRKNKFEDKIVEISNSETEIITEDTVINIESFQFSESIVKVRKGTKVTWINRDSTRHTVTSDESNILTSPLLDTGGSYEFTFNEPGTYRYHCTPHPQMLGAILVLE